MYTATFLVPENTTGEPTGYKTAGRIYLTAGAPITPPTVAQQGYSVVWRLENGDAMPDTMPADNITVYGEWIPDTQAPYTVNHYVQGTDGGYTLMATHSNIIGTVGAAPEFTPLEGCADETQFNVRYDNAVTIAPEGNTVLNVYYDRCTYDITYHLNVADDSAGFAEGLTPDADGTYTVENIMFGATVSGLLTGQEASREGYAFAGWTTDQAGQNVFDATDTMPAENIDLYAQ